eukprot:11710-Heterococcus_DN1.PRE.5
MQQRVSIFQCALAVQLSVLLVSNLSLLGTTANSNYYAVHCCASSVIYTTTGGKTHAVLAMLYKHR